MARATKKSLEQSPPRGSKKSPVRKRAYAPAGRTARQLPTAPEPNRLLKVWRRVLERRLRTRLRGSVAVEVHDNTHTMLTFQRRRGQWRLRLHHMFLAAPDEVIGALAASRVLPRDQRDQASRPAATLENPQSTYVISPVIALDIDEK